MSKATSKAPRSNVVDLTAFRARKAPVALQQQAREVPAAERRYLQAKDAGAPDHIEASLWCLVWADREPEGIAEMLNEWEINFLESISRQKRPATERQYRCLNRIIYMLNGKLRALGLNEPKPSDPPAA